MWSHFFPNNQHHCWSPVHMLKIMFFLTNYSRIYFIKTSLKNILYNLMETSWRVLLQWFRYIL